MKRRRRLVKDIKPLTGMPGWTAEDEEARIASLKSKIADIDQEIAERQRKSGSEH
jgi:hypothetical protein